MLQYLNFLEHILTHGTPKADRTGVGTLSIFGYQLRFDLAKGFPLVTTKKIFIKGVILELLWFLRGETNIKSLKNSGVNIWNAWADSEGELGPIYGKQWRAWATYNGKSIDQIAKIVYDLIHNPNSRRMVVSAWNVAELTQMALPPCHLLFQFYVNNETLSCMVTMRSADAFLGMPFNIASYALLTHMLAHQCDLKVGEVIISIGDSHIYNNHTSQVRLQLSRTPLTLPTLQFNRKPPSIFTYELDDFAILNYQCHPPIKAMIAV